MTRTGECFPRVSVVIPCYNDGKYLPEAVASVKAQTYPELEIVIVDDHSTAQDTQDILSAMKQAGCTVLTAPEGKKGAAAARNAGIARATGDFILPLDADDKIDPTYIDKAVAAFKADPALVICGCGVRFFGLRGHAFAQPPLTLTALILEDYKLVASCLYRKSDWERVGGYDESLALGKEDMIFWLDLLEAGGGVAVLPEELFFYRIRPRSITAEVRGAPTEREKLTAMYQARPELFHRHTIDFMDALARRRAESARRECLFSWKLLAPVFKMEWFLRQCAKRVLGRA
ncbi:MAG: glycosyltransferase family 2 protein [Desulfovibrio sp.]|jgi:glycosyltransferase involved in cell wall biosynthesis|nr:glycosyltransferase family 2 protein [Desulfovibrio sp.]